MNNQRKRALYESIMKNISRQVRRTLNEAVSVEDEDNTGIYIDNANTKFKKLFDSILSISAKVSSLVSDPDYNDEIISKTVPAIIEAKCKEKIEKIFGVENDSKGQDNGSISFTSSILNMEVKAFSDTIGDNFKEYKRNCIVEQNAFVLFVEYTYKDSSYSVDKIYVCFPKQVSDFCENNHLVIPEEYIDKSKIDNFNIYTLLNDELYETFTGIFNIASKKGITLKVQQKNNAYKAVNDVDELFTSIQPLSESDKEQDLIYISNLEIANMTSDYIVIGDLNNNYSNIHIIIEGEKIDEFLEEIEKL